MKGSDVLQQETPPLVSILIPFYNCAYIQKAIESALSQTYSNIEVIVINDGSTKYQELITPYLSKIIYLKQENKGVGAAINLGIKHAKGDYLVWLSSDDFIHQDKVKIQVEFMQENNVLFSFTNFNTVDHNNKVIKYNAGMQFKNELEILKILTYGNPINGCTVMMSKKLIDSVGYFNEELRYVQDYEYWLRVALKEPIKYLPMTLTSYRIHENMGTLKHKDIVQEEYLNVQKKYKPLLLKVIEQRRGT